MESPTAPNPRQGTPTLEPRMEKRTLGPSVELPPELRPPGHSPTELRKLGPPVELPPSSPTRRPGPSGDHLAMNGIHSHPYGGATRAGRRQGSMDGSRRQSSLDRTHSPLLSPAIRIESPTRSPGKPSCLTVFQVREGGGEQGEERELGRGTHSLALLGGGGGLGLLHPCDYERI